MSNKTKNIIAWILTIMLSLLLIISSVFKLMGTKEVVQGAAAMGMTKMDFTLIGLVELIATVLFIIPRTGVLGTLLLAAYMGGAIATHVTHSESILMPVVVQCILWISAVIRFPELTERIMARQHKNVV